MHLLYLNNEITSDYVFSVIKRDVLISNLTQVQRYPAALQTLDGSASQWYQYVYILLLSCSWYNSSWAKKHINVYVVYWSTSKSHTLHLISSSVSLFHTHNQDFAGVQSRKNRLPTQDIAMHKRINFCWKKNPDLSWYKEREIRERGEIRGLI